MVVGLVKRAWRTMAVRPGSEEMFSRGGEKIGSGNVRMTVGNAVSVSAGWGMDGGVMWVGVSGGDGTVGDKVQ